MTNWAASEGIQIFHLRLAINKEPTAEMDEADVVKALQLILTPSNWRYWCTVTRESIDAAPSWG